MGRAREGIALFEEIIDGESNAEEAVITLSRFYRRKGNTIKAELWHLYGVWRFGIDGKWYYYKDYEDQFGMSDDN